MGFKTVEELFVDWENDHVENWDANNLLAKLATWQAHDISLGSHYNDDIQNALKSIRARTIIISCTEDLYFRYEDNAFEAEYISNSKLIPYSSPLGHCVANPGNDSEFELVLDKNIHELLQ